MSDAPPLALPSPARLSAWTSGALAAAHRAGALLEAMRGEVSAAQISAKSSAVDLVSEADKAAEDLLREALAALLPSAGFIGEESEPSPRDSAELFWVVDPLDGTSNYLCGLPLWSVSIGLCDRNLTPLLGVIHAPPLQLSWDGWRGGGVRRNGEPARVRPEPPGGGLHNAMLATGFPYDVGTADADNNIDMFTVMQLRFHKIRRMGSAAIDLALVADGTFDGMWELKLRPWDAAAGMLLVQEAGGLITTTDGGPYTPGDLRMAAAATPELLAEMLAVLATASPPRHGKAC